MATLMVTPFAPYRDGIASYAAQELRSLRDQGHDVEVLSPAPSAAHRYLPLGGASGMARLVVDGARYDRVIIQFGPEMMFGRCRAAGERVAVWLALAALAKRTALDLRIHEIEYGPLSQNPAERRAAGLVVRLADQVSLHTAAERDRLRTVLGSIVDRAVLIDHGRDFVPAITCSPREARVELGLDGDEFTLVAIGFLQRHKGFDRAVEAFTLADLPSARLHVVGSGRVDHPDITGYVQELAVMCREAPRVELHNRFVSDDQFDLWLIAADAVVLPYREIWSSGVVERAQLFDKPVIISDLEQLRHQLDDQALTCGDVGEFAMAMEKLWGESGRDLSFDNDDWPDAAVAADHWDVDDVDPDRGSIQAQIQARARTSTSTSPRSRSTPAGHQLEQLGPLPQPQAVSARPGVTPVKQTVQRLIGWQVDPLAQRVAALQQATIEAVVELENRIEQMTEQADDTSTI